LSYYEAQMNFASGHMKLRGEIIPFSRNEDTNFCCVTINEVIPGMLGENLQPKEKEDLAKIIKENERSFSLNGELGRIKSPLCSIEITERSIPFQSRPHRISNKERDVLRTQLDEMLAKGVIKHSTSSYSSPILFASGAHKEIQARFCLDARPINKIIKPRPYPLPDMETILSRLNGKYYGTLDIRKAFWQAELPPESTQYTSFICDWGQFEYTCLPFGIATASSIFQSILNEILQPLLNKGVLVYIDDIILYADEISEFIRITKAALELIQKTGIKLNAEKCKFGIPEVMILGHILTREGMKPNPEKLEGIMKMPAPRNVKEIQADHGHDRVLEKVC